MHVSIIKDRQVLLKLGKIDAKQNKNSKQNLVASASVVQKVLYNVMGSLDNGFHHEMSLLTAWD